MFMQAIGQCKFSSLEQMVRFDYLQKEKLSIDLLLWIE
jgi:hypothetical protein